MPEWHEPQNENNDPMDMDLSAFSWDNEDINSLFMVLDAAEEYLSLIHILLALHWSLSLKEQDWYYLCGSMDMQPDIGFR